MCYLTLSSPSCLESCQLPLIHSFHPHCHCPVEAHSTSGLNYGNCLLRGLSTSAHSLLFSSPAGLLVRNHCFEYVLLFPQLRISTMVHHLSNKIPNSLELHRELPALSSTPLHAVYLLFIIAASIFLFLFFHLWALCSCHVKCLSTPVLVHGMNIQGKLGVYINPRASPWY